MPDAIRCLLEILVHSVDLPRCDHLSLLYVGHEGLGHHMKDLVVDNRRLLDED